MGNLPFATLPDSKLEIALIYPSYKTQRLRKVMQRILIVNGLTCVGGSIHPKLLLSVQFFLIDEFLSLEDKLMDDRVSVNFHPKNPGMDEDVIFSLNLNYSVVSIIC